MDSAAITRSKKHISSSNGMINFKNMNSEKEIKSCVIVKFYRRICWFVCWFLFSSEATRSSVEVLALQARVFFSSLFKGQPYYVRIKGTASLNGLFSIISIQ